MNNKLVSCAGEQALSIVQDSLALRTYLKKRNSGKNESDYEEEENFIWIAVL